MLRLAPLRLGRAGAKSFTEIDIDDPQQAFSLSKLACRITFSQQTMRFLGGTDVDPAVVKALREKRELQKRLAEIDQFLRLYSEFSGEIIDIAGANVAVDRARDTTRPPTREPIHGHILRGPSTVARFSETILREAGHPLTRGELAAELQARGVNLLGQIRRSGRGMSGRSFGDTEMCSRTLKAGVIG
jgi:hypothetical protein